MHCDRGTRAQLTKHLAPSLSEVPVVAVPAVFPTGSSVLLLSEEVPFVSVVQAA